MKKWAYLLGFLLLSVAAHRMALADDWYHIPLTSSDGTRIVVDFSLHQDWYSRGRVEMVRGLWVHVRSPRSTSSDRVEAEIRNVPVGQDYTDINEDYRFELPFSDNDQAYTGQVNGGLQVSVVQRKQELTVTINGRPLIDPINGTQTFQLNFYKWAYDHGLKE